MKDLRPAAPRSRAPRAPTKRPSQILDAAARVLLRDGRSKVTIEGIAVEAGLGKGTVYEYYGSKAEIFTALRARYTQQTLAAGLDLETAQPPGTSALARVQQLITGMFSFAVGNGELLTILFHEAREEDPDELAPIKAALLERIREGVDAGELATPADPEFTTEFLLHGLHGVMEDALMLGQDGQQVLNRVNAVLTAMLCPPALPQ